MGDYFDSFDCQVQCEEFYIGVEEADIDWMDANVPDVYIEGEPLDGHYFDRMVEEIDF